MINNLNQTNHSLSVAITYPYPLGKASGGARMTREIARHLGKLGVKVVLLPVSSVPLSRFPRPKLSNHFLGFEYDGELAKDSVEIVRVRQNYFHWRLDGLNVRKTIQKILKQHHLDLVLSYYHEAAFLPSFLHFHKIRFGYISTWQSYDLALNGFANGGKLYRAVKKWLDSWLIIKAHRKADIVFATSYFTRNELIDIMNLDAEKIVVCPLGVEGKFLEIPRNEPEEITRFLFFGRFTQLKGIADALEALGLLANRGYDNWTFRVFGQGACDWVRNLASKNRISDKVIIHGPIGDDELSLELQKAHLAILPSHVESFGLSIAEAQAAGIPVIAYQAGSVPEIVENGVTGWLAPYRNIVQLSLCIEKAINNPKQTYQVGLAGRERVKRMFSWEKTSRLMFEKMQEICSNKNKKSFVYSK